MIIRVCDPPQLAIGPPIGFAARGNEFAGWKEPLAEGVPAPDWAAGHNANRTGLIAEVARFNLTVNHPPRQLPIPAVADKRVEVRTK